MLYIIAVVIVAAVVYAIIGLRKRPTPAGVLVSHPPPLASVDPDAALDSLVQNEQYGDPSARRMKGPDGKVFYYDLNGQDGIDLSTVPTGFDAAVAKLRKLKGVDRLPVTEEPGMLIYKFMAPSDGSTHGGFIANGLEGDARTPDFVKQNYPGSVDASGNYWVAGITFPLLFPPVSFIAAKLNSEALIRHETLHYLYFRNYGTEQTADGTPVYALVEHNLPGDPFMGFQG